MTRYDTKMLIPTHGDYNSNFSVTRHDTKMFIPTHGDYNSKLTMIRQKIVDSHVTKVNPSQSKNIGRLYKNVVKF